MTFRTTGILALLLLGVGAFVYFYEIKGGEERAQAEEESKKLLGLEVDSVTAIFLEPAGVAFEKAAGEWEMRRPVTYKADASAVNSLLDRLESAKREREISDDATKHGDYGLAPEKQRFIIAHAGKKDTLYLGDTNPTAAFVFARLNSDPRVYLTAASLVDNANKPVADWRDKNLLEFDANAAKQLVLTTPQARFELQQEEGKWKLRHPMSTAADEDKVSQILNRVESGRVTEFVAEAMTDANAYGFAPPSYEVTVSLNAREAPKTIQFGKGSGSGYYVHDPARPQVFMVDSSLVNELKVSLIDLRDKKLADFASYQIDYLALSYGDSPTIICEKDSASQWRLAAPDTGAAKSWKISSLASTLSSLQAVDFVTENAKDLSPFGLDKPRAVLIAKEKGAELAHVLIGREKDGNVYAKSANHPIVVLVKKDDADRLIVPLSDLIESQK